jgi:iron(III) transport system substrate-binding protein
VEFVDGISGTLHQRYLDALVPSEGRGEVDVMWSSAMDLQMGLVQSGHAQAQPGAGAGLPAWTNYRDMAFATTLEPLVTLINRTLLDAGTRAGSLAEITAVLNANPQGLQGKVACYDIVGNGLGFLALLHESRRDPAFGSFMHALAAARPRLFGSNPPLVDEVASGRAAMAFHVLGAFALRAMRADSALAVAPGRDAQLAVSRIAFVPVSAPHPRAARKFLDFLLSETGQRCLGEAELFPVRASGQAPPELGCSKLAPIAIDRGLDDLLDPSLRSQFMTEWRAALAISVAA